MKQIAFIVVVIFCAGCGNGRKPNQEAVKTDSVLNAGTFGFDLAFLKQHKDVIVLRGGQLARIAIVKDYQARVMTSTALGEGGTSYGWINYNLIGSGKILPHFNPLGGEDRFWVGPEGGQFAMYFKKGSSFDFENWQTPALIDTEPFDLVSADSVQATFTKSSTLTNYNGYTFKLEIKRQIKILDTEGIKQQFNISANDLHAVAFESTNSITNTGKDAWRKKTGLMSIWILGMYNPSEETTIIIPYKKSADFNKKVTDNYFGAIPTDRIRKSDSLLLLRGDGRYRGKVGIAPSIAKNITGSYDAGKHILTLVKFDVDPNADYVNSKWELQQEPYHGDVANAYNDGPLAGGSQLGPFYELESSSPAKELKPGESVEHHHVTLHLEGDESQLKEIAHRLLGIDLGMVGKVFMK